MNKELVDRIKNNPKYKELVSKRSSFAVKLAVFVLVVYYGFVLTIAFNKEFFATKIGDDPENPKRIKTVRSKGYLFVKETNGL